MASKQLQAVHDAAEHEKLTAEMAALNVKQDALEQAQAAERTRKLMESKYIIERQLREKELAKQREFAEILAEKAEIDKILGRIAAEKARKLEGEELRSSTSSSSARSTSCRRWSRCRRRRGPRAAGAGGGGQGGQGRERALPVRGGQGRDGGEAVDGAAAAGGAGDGVRAAGQEAAAQGRDEAREHAGDATETGARGDREEERGDALRLELLAKFEQNERLQRVSAHKRRLKMAQHNKDVERQRLKLLAIEKEQTLELHSKDEEKAHAAIIREERVRRIKLHAPKLKHFLTTKIAFKTGICICAALDSVQELQSGARGQGRQAGGSRVIRMALSAQEEAEVEAEAEAQAGDTGTFALCVTDKHNMLTHV